MNFTLPNAISLLEQTTATLNSLLRNLPDCWTAGNEGADTWSPFEIVGHLIYGERTDWMSRARRILEHGESMPFEPFDRLGHVQEIKGKTMAELLDEFARVRAVNLDALRALNLSSADLDRRGHHPAFGSVALSELLATWAVHDLTHLHQLARVMASQYHEVVGPWSRYLGVLQCAGHSAAA